MQKLAILTSVLLLAAAVVGPVGLAFAEPAGVPKDAEAKNQKVREQIAQERADRVAEQQKKAAEIKAKLEAMKKAAGKDADKKDEPPHWGQNKVPPAGQILEALKAKAVKAAEAKKAADGPSKSQIEIEKQRAEFQKQTEEQRKEFQDRLEQQLKHLKEQSQKRDEILKQLGAEEQTAKEKLAVEQQKKAEQLKKQKYG